MKLYGEKRADVNSEDYCTSRSGGWFGRDSRKIANRRRRDKKLLHRMERRTQKHVLSNSY